MSTCPPRPPHPTRYFPELDKSCFCSPFDRTRNRSSFPSKFRGRMLMSVQRVLMMKMKVLFSCPAKCFGGACQSVVSSPWRRLPSVLTLKGHFFIFLGGDQRKPFWGPMSPAELLLWKEWEAEYVFSCMNALFSRRQPKTVMSFSLCCRCRRSLFFCFVLFLAQFNRTA